MSVGAAAKNLLNTAAQTMRGKLGNLGMLSDETKAIIRTSLPSSAATGGFAMLSGADPLTAALAGTVDLGLNVGGMKLAGRYAPGTYGTLSSTNAAGKTTTRKEYIPSLPQGLVQGLSPVVTSLAIMPLLQNSLMQREQQEVMDQTQSLQQQALQRQLINNLQVQSLSPGTQFQLQGLEQTINPQTAAANALDPYGLSRGMI